ncbi:MAG: CDC48 family AAA ATPase [Negativicutes bacterium]
MKNAELSLKISEALSQDVGRNIARIDPGLFGKIGVQIGDIVEITGNRHTAVRIMPAFADIRNKGLIQIDGITRGNVQKGLDEKIVVSKAVTVEAQEIFLTPLDVVSVARTIKDSAYLSKILGGMPVVTGDRVRVMLFGSGSNDFSVISTKPDGLCVIGASTKVKIKQTEFGNNKKGLRKKISYEDIGGLERELQRIREMVELPLKHPHIFEHLGIEPPKGVLLVGPPGTGKTLIIKAVAEETNCNFHVINGPEIIAKFVGESEAKLREIFEQAAKNAPSIIFIDELDGIAPKRAEVTGEVEKRVVTQLLALMDGLEARRQVIVIGSTNRPDAIDAALRRPGRFDREIYIGVPDRRGRLSILNIHTRGMPLAVDVDLAKLADITHGFVGADLAALCREAAMTTLRGILPEFDMSQDFVPIELIQKLEVKMDHFMQAFAEIEPSAIREVLIETPNVHWDQIGGLANVRLKLQESIEWPLKYEDIYKQAKLMPAKGILLYGKPGTGKTLLAKAIATECQANFISVKGPVLLSKWVGESEKAVREIFKKARQVAPCVIFFDEFDALVPRRGSGGSEGTMDRIVSQMLTEIDGVEVLRNVAIVAATNRPDLIDDALLRAGRFDMLIEIPLPEIKEREAIFKIHIDGRAVAEEVSFAELSKQTDGWSGADIELACRNAVKNLVREHIRSGQTTELRALNKTDFEQVIRELTIEKNKINIEHVKDNQGKAMR